MRCLVQVPNRVLIYEVSVIRLNVAELKMVKILIVDDSSFARRRLKILFESAGHEVVGSAGGGDQALSMFADLQPDVVTLDYLMTGKSGEDVLKEIVQHDPAAKVIMISGSGDNTIEQRVLDAGAKVFVGKFCEQGKFLQAVDHVMNG